MHKLTVEVTLPEELRGRLDARVRAHGGDPARYVCTVLERDLRESGPHPGMSFREIFVPSQPGFDASGMTDEELAEFVEAEVTQYRAERAARDQAGA